MKKLLFVLMVVALLALAATPAMALTKYKTIVQSNGSTVYVELDYHTAEVDPDYWQVDQYRIKTKSGSTSTWCLYRDAANYGASKYVCYQHTIGTSWHTHTGSAIFSKNHNYHAGWWASWMPVYFWEDM